ncbi:periodic tryptophan protein 2 homolog isoform X2 [Venturia canescens]|uniref:periodic tryptophan protein 2 homolog isoform X2 n=1 Tax=Venturia canescens TaxID=32260 RepID=UPI001C9C2997|nr:periodic tryptophan protein 2 homolog isoform X2 [Venturia canescens]
MKFAYKFSNLLGTVYRKGDLIFSHDGSSVISPVGNRITIYDLKNNKSTTLPVESRFNYTAMDLSPNGCTLIAVNEEGEAHVISMISQMVIHKYRFKRLVRAIRFSPDGKHFAVCKENNVFIFNAPGLQSGEFNPFIMERVFHGATDETTCLCWSYDSKLLAVGSKDTTTKLYSLEKWENFKSYTLGSHTDEIVGCYFEKKNYDISTISRNGQLCIWECTIEPEDMVVWQPPIKREKPKESDSEDDVDLDKAVEKTDKQMKRAERRKTNPSEEGDETSETPKSSMAKKLRYKKLARHYLADEVHKQDRSAIVTAAAYHKDTRILVVGFSNGAFFLYELPDVNMIHSLSISNQCISSITLNSTGDWIALGCSKLGQLLVWEWQSETYAMKQQGHSNNMNCLAYSPDGQYIVTGGDDGKVKIWNTMTGFCIVTFQEHISAISSVLFSHNRKFIVSASYDGTARAYDLTRYRNFKTLTSPRPVQFSCLALDSSDEFLAAGGQDFFDIYLWSVKLGTLLEILSGHEGPVASLVFNPSPASTAMASVSWDKTMKLWNAIEKGSSHETIQLSSDGLCVVYKPNGAEVAVATLDGQISFFDCKTSMQTGSIEGRNDLGSGRSDTDLVTAKKSLAGKAFNTLCYSADGNCIIAGGQSKNVCIYNVKEAVLLKKFEITQNRSFDAVDDFINRRKMTEFGNIALIEEREEREGGKVVLRLPGARSGDMASRSMKPEVRVYSLQFSPTGHAWAAATTEGLLIYSLDMGLVFDPFHLELGITPDSVKNTLQEKEFAKALMMSLRLNEKELIQCVVENIAHRDIDLTITSMPEIYVERLLKFLASELESTRHIHFYLLWIEIILTRQGHKMNTSLQMPALLTVQKNLQRRYDDLSAICDFNQYTLSYIKRMGELRKKFKEEEESDDESDKSSIEEMEID